MAPLTPHWSQPSHPDIQEVLINTEQEFTTKSISKIDLPPFGLYAKMSFPPCTLAEKATYATVQMGRDQHFNLNSDLVYINHSCDPSVIFDITSLSILAGPSGLKKNQEITFFYPSTEWDMAQGFNCFCGAEKCRGHISGAKDMKKEQLEGMWLNVHIREMIEERDVVENEKRKKNGNGREVVNGNGEFREKTVDGTEVALLDALQQAKKMVEAAQKALNVYKELHGRVDGVDVTTNGKGAIRENGVGSRELSGEMGGDTSVAV